MKAVTLAGGRPEQETLPGVGAAKPLLPLAAQPALGHLLDRLAEAGIRQAAVVVSSRQGPVAGWSRLRQRPGWRFTFIEQSLPLGTAHAVRLAKDVGQEPFLVVFGDSFLSEGLAELVRRHGAADTAATLLVGAAEVPERHGVVELDQAVRSTGVLPVRRLVEKPPRAAPGSAVLAGVLMLDHRVFPAIDALRPSSRGELELTGAVQLLVERGLGVGAVPCPGFFCDLGLPHEVLRAHRFCLDRLGPANEGEVTRSAVDGRVAIGSRARLVDSLVVGPAVLGQGAALFRSWIGPYTTVGRLAVVGESEVEQSLLLDGCRVRGMASLQDSLVGEGARLTRREARPRAIRVVAGRDCLLEYPEPGRDLLCGSPSAS